MSEYDKNEHRIERRKRNRSPLPVFFAIGALILLSGGVAIFFFPVTEPDQTVPPTTEPVTAVSNTVSTDTPPQPGVEVETRDQIPEEVPVEQEPPEEVIPGMALPTESEKIAARCSVTADNLNTFFQHIDGRDYIRRYKIQETTQTYFTALAYSLLDQPPVVSRESDDLYTILRNMAHFFRIIGKDNILLLKTILDRERDKIEDVAAELYFWVSHRSCTSDQFNFTPSLTKMYEYAGFFLNTMGGRSYLFRRDSRSRLLVNYYSILLVDQANERGINQHGIDIALILPRLVQEIEASNQLIYKENYLDQLYNLMERYQPPAPAM